MDQGEPEPPSLPAAPLKPGDHLCCIYDTAEQQRSVLAQFLGQALARGYKVVCFGPRELHEATLAALSRAGVEVEACAARGQLVLCHSAQPFLRDGTFHPAGAVEELARVAQGAAREGFACACCAIDVAWAVPSPVRPRQLIEYEARVGNFVQQGNCLVLCAYRRDRFDSRTLLEMIHVHPIVIVGSETYSENPFYVPPQSLLSEEADEAKLKQWVRGLAEHYQAQQDLRRLARFWESIVDNANVWLNVFDTNANVLVWNKAAEQISGYRRDEVVGHDKVWRWLYPDERYRREIMAKAAAIVEGREVAEYFETTIRRKDGQNRVISWHSRNLRDEAGNIIGSIALGYDVTDRKELEQQFLHLQKMEAVGRLASGVAHDFNNILTGISAYTEFLLLSIAQDHPARRDVQQIRKLVQSGAQLTGQLLAFSRRQSFAQTTVNLNAVVESTSAMVQRLIGEDIELAVYPGADLWTVRADPNQITQVLVNLAVNARDAMPEGGRLTIETANVVLDSDYAQRHLGVRPGQYVLLSVTDSGCGMDEETRRKAFDPFFTTKEPGRGTGLGLSTVYGIVKQHGGNITVYSELGRGTTFKIYLPRAVEEVEREEPPAAVAHAPGGTETILLVEDEETVREVVRRILEERGYTVLVAARPDEAEQIFAAHAEEIDLLLADVVMPGRRGPELYRQLLRKRPRLRALFMSGYADHGIVENGLLRQARHFIQKPFNAAELAQKVRQALDAPLEEQ